MRNLAIAIVCLITTAATAASDLAVAIAGMLAAEQQCSGILLDHTLVDRVIAGETAKGRSFEYCVRDGCLKGALARMNAMPADEKDRACARWKQTINDAGFMSRH